MPKDQIPMIDAAVARLDTRINRAQATIWKLEDRIRTMIKRVERVRKYSRALGKEKSRIATFTLNLE